MFENTPYRVIACAYDLESRPPITEIELYYGPTEPDATILEQARRDHAALQKKQAYRIIGLILTVQQLRMFPIGERRKETLFGESTRWRTLREVPVDEVPDFTS